MAEKNHQNPKKYSEIFFKFAAPLTEGIMHDKEESTSMLNLGQAIWNKAVADDFPEHPNSKKISMLFPLAKAGYDKELISKFTERKQQLFGNDNFFIVKQNLHVNAEGNLIINVSALDVE